MRSRFLLAGLVILGLSSPSWAEGIGRIKSAVGSAMVERAGKLLPVNPGFEIMPGDVLVTGKGAKMGLTFIDNTRFAAGPNSRVSLNQFEFNDTTHEGKFETQVQKGSLAVVSGLIAKSAKDAMKVRTPSALLGVRGTRFVVEVN